MSNDDYRNRIQSLVEELTVRINEVSPEGIDSATQVELGKLINLLHKLDKYYFVIVKNKDSNFQKIINRITKNNRDKYTSQQQELESKINFVEIAVRSILQKRPNVVLARYVRREIEYFIRSSENFVSGSLVNFYKGFIHLSSTPAKVILGLLIALPIYVCSPIMTFHQVPFIAESTYFGKLPSDQELLDYQQNISLLILAGSAGALGSIISILTRIKQYNSQEYEDSFLPLVIGATKPLIGATFGILIVTLIKCNTLPVKFDDVPGRREYFFYSIAFIIGFSERFAMDIVSRTENAISGSKQTETAQGEATIPPNKL